MWLAPNDAGGQVDFEKRLRVSVNGKVKYNDFVRPDVEKMLERVRVLGDRQRARDEFAEVFRIYPTAQIDPETFSPKTVELFEQVRSEVVPAGSNRKP